MKRIAAVLTVILVLTLACSISIDTGNATNTPPSNDNTIATSSAATLTAMAGGQQPNDTPAAQATNTAPPNCQPLHPGAQSLGLPVGVALSSSANQETVNFYNLQGNLIGSKTLSGYPWSSYDQVHIAGGNNAGFPNLPIVYHAMVPGNELLRLNVNNATTDLGDAPQLVAVTGAEAHSFITYSLNTSGANGWISYLYATEYATVNGASPIMARDEGDGYVLYPLAVHYTGGAAQGIWYTASMYGIGNINFAPYRGLYYYNLSDSTTTTYLPNTDVITGFSPDQTWVSYTLSAGDSPGQAQGSITLKNLITCAEVTIPFNSPDSLGGWVDFSPDNSYVAWLETVGVMENTVWRLRVATIDGTSLVNSELSSLSGLASGQALDWIVPPMKWVSNNALGLTLQISGVSGYTFVIWAPDPANPLDPALGANQSTALGSGKFIGLLYP